MAKKFYSPRCLGFDSHSSLRLYACAQVACVKNSVRCWVCVCVHSLFQPTLTSFGKLCLCVVVHRARTVAVSTIDYVYTEPRCRTLNDTSLFSVLRQNLFARRITHSSFVVFHSPVSRSYFAFLVRHFSLVLSVPYSPFLPVRPFPFGKRRSVIVLYVSIVGCVYTEPHCRTVAEKYGTPLWTKLHRHYTHPRVS